MDATSQRREPRCDLSLERASRKFNSAGRHASITSSAKARGARPARIARDTLGCRAVAVDHERHNPTTDEGVSRRMRRRGWCVQPALVPAPRVPRREWLPLWRQTRRHSPGDGLRVYTVREPRRRTGVDGDPCAREAEIGLSAKAGDDDEQGRLGAFRKPLIAVDYANLQPRRNAGDPRDVVRGGRRDSADVPGSGRRQEGGCSKADRQRDCGSTHGRASEASARRQSHRRDRGRARARGRSNRRRRTPLCV